MFVVRSSNKNISPKILCKQIRKFSHAQPEISSTSSIDPKEIENLGKFSNDWWNLHGPVKALHSMNMIRVPFIRSGLISTGKVNRNNLETLRVLEGVNILEVGCGGGILSESIARLHANVTAIDPGPDVLQVAQDHLKNKSPDLIPFLDYRCESLEDHMKENKGKYDAIIVSEVIEHVNEKESFLKHCSDSINTNGSIFLTTLNRTNIAWLTAVLIAENFLKLLPKNTHDWNKFITPNEVQKILEHHGVTTILVNGLSYNVVTNSWGTSACHDISYAMQAVKY